MGFKLLLTENQSALGEVLCRALENHAFSVVRPADDELVWSDPEALDRYLHEHRPSLLINTRVPSESEGDGAFDCAALAQACARQQIPCIHLSSYRVFGSAPCEAEGFDEQDIPQPDDGLGQSLRRAEEAFLAVDKALVLRLPWLVMPDGDNIFTRIASRLMRGEPLAVSDIDRGCPMTLDEVQRILVAVVLQMFCGAQNWGVIHLHTSDACSEAEFADYIARLLEKEGHAAGPIEVLRNPEFRLLPGCSLLQGSRCMNNFGVQLRSWRQGIKPLVQALVTTRESQPN